MIVKYENDVMNDEELDAVAGGTDAESESLFNALKKAGITDKYVEHVEGKGMHAMVVEAILKDYGVPCIIDSKYDNIYYLKRNIGGQVVEDIATQDEVVNYIIAQSKNRK